MRSKDANDLKLNDGFICLLLSWDFIEYNQEDIYCTCLQKQGRFSLADFPLEA